MSYTLTLAAAAVVLIGWGVFVFAFASRGGSTLYDPDNYDSTLCAPSRRANITASQPQAQRRTLGPPAGWREPGAIVPTPAAVQVDDDGEDGDELDDWGDEPWHVVEDWPKRQAATVEPVPLVVNRMAARFASLEVRP